MALTHNVKLYYVVLAAYVRVTAPALGNGFVDHRAPIGLRGYEMVVLFIFGEGEMPLRRARVVVSDRSVVS